MTGRRVLSALLALFVASMACSGGGATLPATDTPAPQPTSDNSNSNSNSNGNGTDNAGPTVTVVGTVTDQAGGQPIKGVFVYILQPGTMVQTFLNDHEPDAEVFAVAQTDTQGVYTLNKPLQRNQAYSFLVAVNGYKPEYTDNFLIDNSGPDPYAEDAQLVR
jgi:hypothetical protein